MGVLQDVRAAIAEAKRSLDKQVASPALRMLIQGAAIAAACWAGAGLLCVVAVSLALVLSIAALSLLGLGAVLFFVTLTAGAWAFVLSWAAAWAYIAMSTLGWASKAMHRSWTSLASQAPVSTRRRAVGPSTPSKATPSPAASGATSPPTDAASAADADANGSGHEGQAAAPQDVDAWRGHELPASVPPFALSEAPLHQQPQHQQAQQQQQQQQHTQQQHHHERQHPVATVSNQAAPAANANSAPVPFPQLPAPSDPAPASNVADVDDILSASTQQPLPAGPAVMPGASSPQHPHAGHAAQHLVRRKVSPLSEAMSRPVPVV